MEDSETPRMHKYVANKTTRIMMATVRHVTALAGRTKSQTDGFLFVGVYKAMDCGARNQFHASGLEQFTARFF